MRHLDNWLLPELTADMPWPRTGLPLYLELQNRLRAAMGKADAGRVLPSERFLADALSVNRRTLSRALNELIDEGVLERQGRRLTVAAALAVDATPHPLLSYGYDAPLPVSLLRVACYENLPRQQLFWRWAAERFNETNLDVHVELLWAPRSVTNPERLADFVCDESCDMVVHSTDMGHALLRQGVLSPLPDGLRSLAMQEAVWAQLQSVRNPSVPSGLPVHWSSFVVAWNADLLDTPPRNEHGLVAIDELVAWLPTQTRRLNGGTRLLDNAMRVLIALGTPPQPFANDDLQLWLGQVMAVAEALAKVAPWLDPPKDVHATQYQPFIAGDSALFVGPSSMLFGHWQQLKSPVNVAMLKPLAGAHLDVGVTAIGVSKMSEDSDACTRFMKFLMSDFVQQQLADLPMNFPIHSAALSTICQRTGMEHSDVAAKQLPELALSGPCSRRWTYMLRYEIQEQLARVFRGEQRPTAKWLRDLTQLVAGRYPQLVVEPES